MLVIGAGDPRHLIRTLASQSDIEKVNKLEFYLWEQNAHVYCRQVNTYVANISLIVNVIL